MGSDLWKIYSITEDDLIEYYMCIEKLEALGIERTKLDNIALHCTTCYLFGRCNVSRMNMFLGAKTC